MTIKRYDDTKNLASKVGLPTCLPFSTSSTCLRRSFKPANGFTICLADDDVGLVISAELGRCEPNETLRLGASKWLEYKRTPIHISEKFLLFSRYGSRVGWQLTQVPEGSSQVQRGYRKTVTIQWSRKISAQPRNPKLSILMWFHHSRRLMLLRTGSGS